MKELARTSTRATSNMLRCAAAYRPIISFVKPPQLITHCEVQILPFSTSEFQRVVLDVPNYCKFVPYCKKSEVKAFPKPQLAPNEGSFVASICMAFMAVQLNYLSKVDYKPGLVTIRKHDQERTFKELKCDWKLEDLGSDKCKLTYCIKFMLDNPIYNSMAKAFTDLLAGNMNRAFIQQTKKLHKANSTASAAAKL